MFWVCVRKWNSDVSRCIVSSMHHWENVAKENSLWWLRARVTPIQRQLVVRNWTHTGWHTHDTLLPTALFHLSAMASSSSLLEIPSATLQNTTQPLQHWTRTTHHNHGWIEGWTLYTGNMLILQSVQISIFIRLHFFKHTVHNTTLQPKYRLQQFNSTVQWFIPSLLRTILVCNPII